MVRAAARPEEDGSPEGAATTLELLAAVEAGEAQSQRSLAQRLGVALGLTNAYLRRAMRKGLVKVREAPARRYAYYLTPLGFAEKARLTTEYLHDSFSFFRRARADCDEALALAARRGQRRIVLAGGGELAEVAVLAAADHQITLVGLLDPGCNAARFQNIPVLQTLAEAGACDAVLVTDIVAPQSRYDELVTAIGAERVLAPRLLRIRTAADRA